MTSVAEALGERAPSLAEMRSDVTAELVARLGYDGVAEAHPGDVWALADISRSADTSKDVAENGTAGISSAVTGLGGAQAW